MFLKKLIVSNFRNYGSADIEFSGRGNILSGGNGQGKTNLLEAIYFLSIFRSFRGGGSADFAQWGGGGYGVNGFFETGSGIERSVMVSWSAGGGKEVFLDGERIPGMSHAVGIFPMVVLAPESLEISQGPPQRRRRFLDFCLSLADREYLQNLMAYRRVVRQRNRLLMDAGGKRENMGAIAPWDEKLVQCGSFIVKRRLAAIGELSGMCRETYLDVSGGSEDLTVEYLSTIPGGGDIEESYRSRLAERFPEELGRKMTLTGPHRDDLRFRLNGHDARAFGSQGQHKTILLALKSAEMQYVSECTGAQPIILLDDFFALLDRRRIEAFLEILKGYDQFFITATSEQRPRKLFYRTGFDKSELAQFLVRGGTIRRR